jgi:Na+/H+ antiporter NhaA
MTSPEQEPAATRERLPAAEDSRPPRVTFSGATAWGRSLETPLRKFLRTETGSAAILLAATVAALIWVNIDVASYETVWRTRLSVTVGGHGVSDDLQGWVNSGLMTLFFLVIGLEARREFDMGELRVRQRIALPVLAGLGGVIVPIMIYLAVNAGRPSGHGWGSWPWSAVTSRTGYARIWSRSRWSTTWSASW